MTVTLVPATPPAAGDTAAASPQDGLKNTAAVQDGASAFQIAAIDFDAPDAHEKFVQSLRTTGFAVLRTHPVDWHLVDTVYSEWRGFLLKLHEGAHVVAEGDEVAPGGVASSTEQRDQSKSKVAPERLAADGQTEVEAAAERLAAEDASDLYKRYFLDTAMHDGYFPMKASETAKGATVRDLKHYYHCYFPGGRYPAEVSSAARQLFGQATDLGKQLLGWIEADIRTTLPETARRLDERCGCSLPESVGDLSNTLLRVLHYPAYDESKVEPGAVRAAAHEDINLITILPSGSSRGLEVWCQEDQMWYQVPVDNQCIIVNCGDMLQELTDHAYVSTTHRVVKPRDAEGTAVGDRLSVPVFIHARNDFYLSERFPRARLYLEERLRELGHLK